MPTLLSRLRRRLFGIALEEATIARRGFRPCAPEARARLEGIGQTFLLGYHAALEDADPWAIARRVEQVEAERRGFAFEGAAMGMTLLDLLLPGGRGRLRALLDGPGAPHTYMVHVGSGWALARLRRPVAPLLRRLDPLLGWLALDGFGFHEGYFAAAQYLGGQPWPARLSGYGCRVFDQGFGRSLWFSQGASSAAVAAAIAGFPASRHPDLWSGVGLAAAYAGGADWDGLHALRAAAGPLRAQLAQGAAFAAEARRRAGNPAAHTDLACQVFCGVPADFAADVTQRALADLVPRGAEPAYEDWRRRITAEFEIGSLVG